MGLSKSAASTFPYKLQHIPNPKFTTSLYLLSSLSTTTNLPHLALHLTMSNFYPPIPGSYPTDNILYARSPDGTLIPLINASGTYIPASVVPGHPLLTDVVTAEKAAAEKKAAEVEEEKKAAEEEKRKKVEEAVRKVSLELLVEGRVLIWVVPVGV